MYRWVKDTIQYLKSKFHDRSLCLAHAGGREGLVRVDQGLVRVKALLEPAEMLV